MRREADLSKGIPQCEFISPNSLMGAGYKCCTLEANHNGGHAYCGEPRDEWILRKRPEPKKDWAKIYAAMD